MIRLTTIDKWLEPDSPIYCNKKKTKNNIDTNSNIYKTFYLNFHFEEMLSLWIKKEKLCRLILWTPVDQKWIDIHRISITQPPIIHSQLYLAQRQNPSRCQCQPLAFYKMLKPQHKVSIDCSSLLQISISKITLNVNSTRTTA